MIATFLVNAEYRNNLLKVGYASIHSFNKSWILRNSLSSCHNCIKELERLTKLDTNLTAFSDSQKILKPISSASVDSKLVLDSANVLKEMATPRELTLDSKPYGYGENKLARCDSPRYLDEAGRSFDITKPTTFSPLVLPVITSLYRMLIIILA